MRLTRGNPHLASISDQMMVDYLANLDHENITFQVKSIIIAHLHDGQIDINGVASKLNVSVRNLQRKLKDAAT